jgi:YD repeat-containing protein
VVGARKKDAIPAKFRFLERAATFTNTYDGTDLGSGSAFDHLVSDGDGNLLSTSTPSSGTTTYTWDGENRMTAGHTYNGDGQLVQEASGLNQVWDGENILLETDGNGSVQAVYTLEPETYGNLISQSRGGVDSYYIFDGLGSTTILTADSGSRTNQYFYDAFGNALGGSGGTATTPFQYVGFRGIQTPRGFRGIRRVALGVAAQGSHRSVLAQLRHTAPHVTFATRRRTVSYPSL